MKLEIKNTTTQFVLTTIILISLFILFYWRLLFEFDNFISFGNFSEVLSIPIAKESIIFYNPYSNFGIYNSFPLGNLEYISLTWLMIIFPSVLFGLLVGTKLFIVITSVIYGLSFYLFTSIFTNKYFGRLFGTIFFFSIHLPFNCMHREISANLCFTL